MFVHVRHTIKRAQSVRTSTKIMTTQVGRQLCSNPNLSSTRCVGTYLCVFGLLFIVCERAAFGWPSLGLGQKERGPKSPLKQRSSTATIPV